MDARSGCFHHNGSTRSIDMGKVSPFNFLNRRLSHASEVPSGPRIEVRPEKAKGFETLHRPLAFLLFSCTGIQSISS